MTLDLVRRAARRTQPPVETHPELMPFAHQPISKTAQERSFAGQFKTVLDVRGVDSVLEAIWSIWATASSPAVQTYWQRKGGASRALAMAVIIQEMVEPVAAGVALSRNPVTGADEIVVEAVRGRGDALVQSGVTPYRWIFKGNRWLEQPAG